MPRKWCSNILVMIYIPFWREGGGNNDSLCGLAWNDDSAYNNLKYLDIVGKNHNLKAWLSAQWHGRLLPKGLILCWTGDFSRMCSCFMIYVCLWWHMDYITLWLIIYSNCTVTGPRYSLIGTSLKHLCKTICVKRCQTWLNPSTFSSKLICKAGHSHILSHAK